MEKQFPPFLKINYKSKLEQIDEQSQINETISLFTTLTYILEEKMGKEINKFFNKILPENTLEDVFKVNIAISENSTNLKDKKLINDTLNTILNKKEEGTLNFNNSELNDLSLILSVIYKKISNNKIIKNYKTLLKEIDKFKNKNFDILRHFLNENFDNKKRESHSPPIINPKMDDFIFSNAKFNSPKKKSDSKLTYIFKEKKEFDNFIIPIECMILLKKYEKIKKLQLTLENDISKETIRNNIFILLNAEWLFQNVIEININLSNEEMNKDYFTLYNEKLIKLSNKSKQIIKNTNYSGFNYNKRIFDPIHEIQFKEEENEDDISDNENDKEDFGTESFDDNSFSLAINEIKIDNENYENNKNLTYDDFLNKYNNTFELIIIYSFFISKLNNICIANFTIPDEMENDILNCLNKNGVILMDFHFLSFFINCSKLIRFTCDFNIFDSNCFEKVMGLIYNNSELKYLRLSFFPPDDFFSPQMLLKLLFSLKYNFNSIFPNVENFSNFEGGVHTEIDTLILNKLINSFENNLSKFFNLLTKKKGIKELSLLFEIPSVLQNNEFYLLILIKFFINLFILLEYNFNNYETLIIQAEYSSMDNRKNPFLSEFFSKLKLYQMKSSKLHNLTFHSKFYNISHIYTIISPNLTSLSIGTLDKDTFTNLLLYITSSEYSSISNLITLQISLNNNITNYDSISDLFYLLFTQYPKSLKEIIIISFIEINFHNLSNLIGINNFNSLKKILLQFSKRSLREREDFQYDSRSSINSNSFVKEKETFTSYYIVRNKKMTNVILFFMNSLSKKINKNFMCYNIFHGIEKFTFNKREKEVFIKYK